MCISGKTVALQYVLATLGSRYRFKGVLLHRLILSYIWIFKTSGFPPLTGGSGEAFECTACIAWSSRSAASLRRASSLAFCGQT